MANQFCLNTDKLIVALTHPSSEIYKNENLLTGGVGFIGSEICSQVLNSNSQNISTFELTVVALHSIDK